MPSRRPTSRSPLTALLIALLAVLVLAGVLLRGPLSSLVWRALSPIVSVRDSLSGSEAATLRAELASTSAALADRDQLARENAQLRLELGRPDVARPLILAGVLMRPPGTPYDTLIVDAGTAEGVAVGDRVLAGALMVGAVDEVYANSARVALYSAPGQSYDAVLQTGDAGVLPIVVEGQGAGSLSARVPSATAVKVGDTVSFPGLQGGLIGVVAGISGADTDTFRTIYLRLPANIFSLEYVYIEK